MNFEIKNIKNLRIDIKMYMSENSKSKISDLKAQKMLILWTLKHVSALSEHPAYTISNLNKIRDFFKVKLLTIRS